jgi:hypothetical protein
LLRFVRATKEDHDRIRQFLAQFPNDYLPDVVPRHLAARRGGFYLAWEDDRLVGTCAVALPKAQEAILFGMRVATAGNPDGVREEVAHFQLEEARRLGAQVVRVLVPVDQAEATHVLQDRLGFRVVDQWAVGEVHPLPVPADRPREAGPAWAIDRERVSAFVREHGGDLWADDEWAVTSLSFQDVWRRFESGGVALAPLEGAVEALALLRVESRETLHLNYFRAIGQMFSALLDYLWNEARAWGAQRCRFGLSLHAAERLRAAVPGTEIQWRGLVLERQLALLPSEG